MERKITIEESVPYTEDYQNKMLEENQVEGLLEMHGRGMDDKSCYDYDVSGRRHRKTFRNQMRFQSNFLPGSACQSTPRSNRSVN